MTIEPKISKYIDIAIERERQISDKRIEKYLDTLNTENNRHHTALKESFQHEVQMLAERINERPTRDEVREIAHDEIYDALKPVNAKLDYLNEERQQMMEAISEIKA